MKIRKKNACHGEYIRRKRRNGILDKLKVATPSASVNFNASSPAFPSSSQRHGYKFYLISSSNDRRECYFIDNANGTTFQKYERVYVDTYVRRILKISYLEPSC